MTTFEASVRGRGAAASRLRRVLALHVARTLARLGFAGCVAIAVGQVVMHRDVTPWVIAAGATLMVLAAVLAVVGDRAQADAEMQVAADLREAVGEALAAMPARRLQAVPAGHLAVGLQRHPDAVAALTIGHRVASIMMAIGPLSAAAALMLVSWQAALLVLGLTPVMIVFFVLVGDRIRRWATAQETAFGHLAGQFADRIRALPTVLANDAVAVEEEKLLRRLRAYMSGTVGVLRIAFLNAAIIDFFSSLSIAMLAVFLGLGHLKLVMIPGFAGLELWQSLFILMVAPEFFAPFRRYAEQYHAKAEGNAAAAAMDALFCARETLPLPVLDGVDVGPLPATGLVAVVGPSGSGKTTLLRRLCGVDGRPAGSDPEPAARDVTWVSTDAFVPAGRLVDAIGWNLPGQHEGSLSAAADALGLVDDRLLPGGLDARIAAGGANLSGGQRVRLSVARALVAGRPVFADEPTAKLDARNAAAVRTALRDLATRVLVVVATHDRALAAIADRVIDLERGARPGTTS